jgi:hypothetical protein
MDLRFTISEFGKGVLGAAGRLLQQETEVAKLCGTLFLGPLKNTKDTNAERHALF